MFAVTLEALEECPDWSDEALAGYEGATVFHERWYLRELGVARLWVVRERGRFVAGMPAFESPDGLALSQSSLSIPYAGPVLRPSDRDPRRRMLRARGIHAALIDELSARYRSIELSLGHGVGDLVPFLRAGFSPELRYTYVIERGRAASRSGGRRNDLVRASKAGLRVEADPELARFDVAAALAWSDEPDSPRRNAALLRAAIGRGRGQAWVALAGAEAVAGLFASWDTHHAYTTHAYMNAAGASLGASTLLYTHAARVLHERGLDVDLEGSVLVGVERFYQSLGATQVPYLRLHWRRGPARAPGAELYDYS